jgi:NitT/TauT family transport system substrate-binding protein
MQFVERSTGKRFFWPIAAAALQLVASTIAHAGDKLTYSNDWFPSGDKGIQYYALNKGFFTNEGLDVTFITAKGSSDSITRVATGSADVGSGSIVALLQAKVQSNVPVKTAVAFYNLPPDSIMTTEGSRLKSLKDLEGTRIGTATFASSNVFWPLVVSSLHLDESKITLVKVDTTALDPMLFSGQVDGTISWMTSAPLERQGLSERNKKLVILPWSAIGFEGYSYSAIVSDKLINERPDVARRFVRAIIAAGKAALKDPTGVGRSIKALYPDVDEGLMEKQFDSALPLMSNEVTEKEGFGSITKARLQTTWGWVAKAQGYEINRLDPEEIVARSIIP